MDVLQVVLLEPATVVRRVAIAFAAPATAAAIASQPARLPSVQDSSQGCDPSQGARGADDPLFKSASLPTEPESQLTEPILLSTVDSSATADPSI